MFAAATGFAQDTQETAESRPAPMQDEQQQQQARARDAALDDAIEDFETIVITATRTPRPILTSPASVYTKTNDQIILEDLSRTFVDSLRYTPGVTIQKTSYGQSSPYLRGLTGYHTLLLVDGIRLNDSVLRSGPNELWATIDAYSVDKYELVLGPSSVLYGSDSMGGTVNVFPRARHDDSCCYDCDRRLIARYSSAENAITYRAEVEGNVTDRFGFLIGGTEAEFGDLYAGGDVNEQPFTGYGLHALDGTFDFKLTNKWNLRLLGQAISLDDVERTHQTIHGISYNGTTIGTDLRRRFDFERELSAVTLDGHDLGCAIDRARLQVSYQHYGELQDRIRANGVRNVDAFDVHTLGLVANASSKTRIGYLTYGVDYYHDRVDSTRDNYNAMGTLTGHGVQGVVGDDSSYDLLGAFIQDEFSLGNCWSIVAGARFTYAAVESDHVADPVLGDIPIEDDWANVVGSARVVYRPTKCSSIYGGVAQGYRTPNLSDLTRLDIARTNELEVPSPDLDPEHSLSFEIGGRTEGRFSVEGAYFFTLLDDIIIRRPTAMVGPGGETVVIKDNAGEGHVQGIDVAASYRISKNWIARVTGTWQDGQLSQYPTSGPQLVDEPLSRMAPLQGSAQVRWHTADERFWVEARGLFVNQQTRLTTADQNDTQRIPPGGTPGYVVFGLHAGARLNNCVTLFGGVDNVLDKNYRVHGSGVQEPGINAMLGVEMKF
jgi:hemoglobin/transferrin/lactoferrin receptor protein